MRGHVYGFVIADDGEIRQEDSYSEDLGRNESHVYVPLCWTRGPEDAAAAVPTAAVSGRTEEGMLEEGGRRLLL